MNTLAELLIKESEAKHAASLACIEANRARIEAFDALMHKLGGDHQHVGEFSESVVVHGHTCKVMLRLQLCANLESAEWTESNLTDLEARLGHSLPKFIRRDDSAYSAFLHPTCGTIDIVVSGCQRMAESRFVEVPA